MLSRSSYVEELAEHVIGENEKFSHLWACKVCYMQSDKVKKTNGKIVYADTAKVSDLWHTITGLDFIITFYASAFSLTEEARLILMEHELMHIGCEDGVIKIIPHDIDDFRYIISKYGMDWAKK